LKDVVPFPNLALGHKHNVIAMKRILIPADFSPCARNALQIGALIAGTTGAKILLLHILYSPLGLEKLPTKTAEYPEIKEAMSSARKLLKKEEDLALLKDIKVETKIEIGTPAQNILSTAKSWKADMIIIGSHGLEESEHLFVGSNAQKVLHGAECPVLSVQKNHKIKDIRKLIFASRNFDCNSTKPFEKILNLAKAFRATVELLHVNTPIEFKNTRTIHAQMDAFEKQFPTTKFTRTLYTDFDVHTGVVNYLKKKNNGIVALCTRTRFKIPSYTLGVNESVAYHSPVPMLSVNLK
jgi:nucleotide-binding universal stress UspA family protein